MIKRLERFDRNDVATIDSVQREMHGPYGSRYQPGDDIYDDSCEGLLVRVQKKGSVWYVRGRLGKQQKFWRIKNLERSDDPKALRDRATQARLLARRGIDPQNWLLKEELGGEVERHFDEGKDGWTWETGRDRYLEHVEKTLAPATFADYRRTLRSHDFDVWKERLVKNIKKADVQALQTAIVERGVIIQAAHALRVAKACLSWLASNGKSGLLESPAVAVRPAAKSKQQLAKEDDDRDSRVPKPAELGFLAWSLDDSLGTQAARCAAALVLFTAQRRETVSSARRRDFEELDGNVGLWKIPGQFIKGKQRHTIPLPPTTWQIVRRALALSQPNDDWLFPQLRKRRATDKGDNHMSGKSIGDAMVETGSPVRPHACRRAFATHGESLLGFSRGDVKAILDHSEGQSADITAIHYALHDGLHFKWRIMRAWETWLLKQVAAARPAGVTRDLPYLLTPI